MYHTSSQKIDAVFEGGGVKGSGLVGAIAVAEEFGYQFINLAGTSAGAIIAALVAAGYCAGELKTLMDEIDYARFKDANTIGKIPLAGPALNLLFQKGIYRGDFLKNWIGELLAKKGIRTFGDLVIREYADDPQFRYKLQVVVSDISRGQLLVMPRDAKDFGMNPDNLEVALAVRMSMSIPYFYKPVKQWLTDGKKAYLVDGGILSNYPVFLLDEPQKGVHQDWPTIGFKLVEPEDGKLNTIIGPITLFAALFSTMMEAHDARYIKDTDFMRTIPIPTLGVHTTEFDITRERKEALYQSGMSAGRDFFTRWNFADYQTRASAMAARHRRDEMWARE